MENHVILRQKDALIFNKKGNYKHKSQQLNFSSVPYYIADASDVVWAQCSD